MRAIKFRGRTQREGKYIYGDMVHMEGGRVGIKAGRVIKVVEAESVAQFVGYDADDKELYEGDDFINEYGEVCVADLIHYAPRV